MDRTACVGRTDEVVNHSGEHNENTNSNDTMTLTPWLLRDDDLDLTHALPNRYAETNNPCPDNGPHLGSA